MCCVLYCAVQVGVQDIVHKQAKKFLVFLLSQGMVLSSHWHCLLEQLDYSRVFTC